MRVIAGSVKGHGLVAPKGEATRPTADRVKEALFSMLQPVLPGASVIDLFAGSGALGIEALSRGARQATFVERDRRALDSLRRNLGTTGLGDRAVVLERDVGAVLSAAPEGAPFDIAFLDPPYGTAAEVIDDVLAALVEHLATGATVSVERGVRDPAPSWPSPLLGTRERRYGDTVLYTADSDDGGHTA